MTRNFLLKIVPGLLLAVLAGAATLNAQTASPSSPSSASSSSANDAWKSLQFLVGTWEAKTAGGAAGAQAAGSYSFRTELNGHILARHSATAACKAPDAFDCEHGDLLYIYEDMPGQPLKAIYFDSEGHVLHYAVTTPTPTSVLFATDTTTPGPQFRLTYELKDGAMSGKFQGKMPGQPDFQSYLEWSGKKK